ncbi:MAG: DUF1343 domain-containing protein [Candidatus Marinimicrobia bacterium]|nr:DUF1343 domain-containing protein [Candidatus Neomarinimicrobiota bacterium]MCF7850063.1 DUF1343 domain-containing protein [Candidatus Neomarinimicrobiota bacterium]MCF7904723.1 DUF1343 domain-containing protein [Candidatus Neomarinimicrobiota bacterium]
MKRNLLLLVIPLFIWTCASTTEVTETKGQHQEQQEQYGETQVSQEIEHVLTGLDVLKQMKFRPLMGKRVGVVTNHTALSRDGEHLVDLLFKAPDVELKAIYAPEHGFRGDVQGGDHIDTAIDPKTQVPIYSLYGATRQPDEEMIEEIDVLIFDIQDVGARFYTYISTMGYVMQAGAQYNIPVMILDRPNPIGRAIGGNVRDEGFESFVGLYPIPIRYGLTIGELAQMVVGEKMIEGVDSVELHVVQCDGWTGTYWDQTDLKWTPPSPNMRNTNETLTYPGLCLLEGVAISEGRGTEYPFELIGTPYFDSQTIINGLRNTDITGYTLEPAVFTPIDMPGVAMNPIFEGELVNGFRINVTDPDAFKPVEFLIHLLVIAKQEYPNDFGWRRATGPDRLWGGTYLREMVDAGHAAQEIIAVYQDELQAYSDLQQKYIIYK